LQAACLAPPALKAMAPAMIGWDVRNDWAYEGGAFNLLTNIAWAAQLTAETVKRKGDVAAFSDLSASPFAHISGATAAGRPPVVEKHLLNTFYGRWLDPGNEDGYWDRISPAHNLPALRDAAIPTLFVGGWFDSHLPGTIAGYRALEDTGTARLYVGPWAHFPVDRKIAGEDYGPDAVSNIDRLQVAWFDAILKEGRMPGADEVPSVSLFDLGAKRWKHMPSWPAESAREFYLASDGRAAIDIASGTLSPTPEAPSSDMLVHDPWRPVPAVGCGHGIPPGPQNRDQVDNRPDVLTYTTAPLDAELAVAGECEALLYLDADQPAFDVSCTLSRVTPDGRSTGIAAGYLSLRSHDGDAPLSIPLRGTCITFQPGDSLRLSIAAAAWPTYPVNPGSGAFPADVHRSECRIITLQLKHGLSCPSQLRLTKETQA
jgi:putative CocE/NonD family hydrolase